MYNVIVLSGVTPLTGQPREPETKFVYVQRLPGYFPKVKLGSLCACNDNAYYNITATVANENALNIMITWPSKSASMTTHQSP